MATPLITSGTATQSCTPFAVTAGVPVAIHAFGVSIPSGAIADANTVIATLDMQDSGGGWTVMDKITVGNKGRSIFSGGTWRVTRLDTGITSAYDRD
jgi:hypothetical protein